MAGLGLQDLCSDALFRRGTFPAPATSTSEAPSDGCDKVVSRSRFTKTWMPSLLLRRSPTSLINDLRCINRYFK